MKSTLRAKLYSTLEYLKPHYENKTFTSCQIFQNLTYNHHAQDAKYRPFASHTST